MAKKFKMIEEPYTRTVIDPEKKEARNQIYDIMDKIVPKTRISYNQYVKLDMIIPNPLNEKYMELTTEEEVRALADNIAAYGLMENLMVMRMPGEEKFMLLSGEKRSKALHLLRYEGNDPFPNGVPVNIVEEYLSEEEQEIMLHSANLLARNYQPETFFDLVKRFEELLRANADKKGEKIKNINALIANLSGLSERKVRRYRSLIDNLIPELKTELFKNTIGQRDAEGYIKLSDEDQMLVYTMLQNGHKMTVDEVNAYREEEAERRRQTESQAEEMRANMAHEEGPSGNNPKHQGEEAAATTNSGSKPEKTIEVARDKAKKMARDKMGERSPLLNTVDVVQGPGVRKRILERELEKLSKGLLKAFQDYMNKQEEYRKEFGEYAAKYEKVKPQIREVILEILGGDE